MPQYVYFEEEAEPIEVTSEDIVGCGDVAQLLEWDGSFADASEDIKAHLKGVTIAQVGDPSWIWRACQKLGWIGRGRSRIRRRLKELGYDVQREVPALQKLQIEYRKLKSESAVAVEFLRIAEQQMVPTEFSRIVHEATRRADEEATARKAFFEAQANAKRFAA